MSAVRDMARRWGGITDPHKLHRALAMLQCWGVLVSMGKARGGGKDSEEKKEEEEEGGGRGGEEDWGEREAKEGESGESAAKSALDVSQSGPVAARSALDAAQSVPDEEVTVLQVSGCRGSRVLVAGSVCSTAPRVWRCRRSTVLWY
eukprot:2153098-Rhodomonas_salina.1